MGASRTLSLQDLREHLSRARERISLEKKQILDLYPLPKGFSREEYVFSYIRAERIGMRIINRKLADIAWLPMQLDPADEVLTDNHHSLKRWLTSSIVSTPDAEEFGNDFIHALARGGMEIGWKNPEINRLATRIGDLFRDLSCLVGLIYYCTWLDENNIIQQITLTDPSNLSRSVEELATLIQSPKLYALLRAKERELEKKQLEKPKTKGSRKQKARPILRVITNQDYLDPYLTDPLPV